MLNESYMKYEIRQFLEESIRLELNMSELYQFFYAKFPEDSQFWWDLSREEINHASLIRTISDKIFPERIVPLKEVDLLIERIREINFSIQDKIKEYRKKKPMRYEAFLYAFYLENSSGEIHFDLFMNELPESDVEKIYQKLNGEDKNHAMRINEYMEFHNITNPGQEDFSSSYPG